MFTLGFCKIAGRFSKAVDTLVDMGLKPSKEKLVRSELAGDLMEARNFQKGLQKYKGKYRKLDKNKLDEFVFHGGAHHIELRDKPTVYSVWSTEHIPRKGTYKGPIKVEKSIAHRGHFSPERIRNTRILKWDGEK